MKKIILAASLSLIVIACDNREIPKTQDADGNCRQSFVEAYNKVQGTSFETLNDQKAKEAMTVNCKAILKAYGASSEACLATNLANGEQHNLSTKDLKETCAKAMEGKFYGTSAQ